MEGSGSTKGKAVGVAPSKLAGTAPPGKGLVIFLSCGSDQESHEWTERSQGVFTYWLARGLAGHADAEVHGNRDGAITLDELHVRPDKALVLSG